MQKGRDTEKQCIVTMRNGIAMRGAARCAWKRLCTAGQCGGIALWSIAMKCIGDARQSSARRSDGLAKRGSEWKCNGIALHCKAMICKGNEPKRKYTHGDGSAMMAMTGDGTAAHGIASLRQGFALRCTHSNGNEMRCLTKNCEGIAMK